MDSEQKTPNTPTDSPDAGANDAPKDAGTSTDSPHPAPANEPAPSAPAAPAAFSGSSMDAPSAPTASHADVPAASENADTAAPDAVDAPATPPAAGASILPGSSTPPTVGMPASSTYEPSAATGMYGSTPPQVTVMGGPRKSRKGLIFGVSLAAIVLILLGGAASAYYVIMNKPQNVLGMALLNTFDGDKVQSMSFDGQIDVREKGSQQTFSSTFTGASKQEGAFTFSAKIDALVTNVTLDARSTDGKTYYVKVGGLDGLSSLLGSTNDTQAKAMAPLINGLNNQWIEINQSMINQLTGGSTNFNTNLSAADRKKLIDLYKKNQFLVVQKTLPGEKIKGKNSYHYQIVVDKTKLKAYISAVKEANIQSIKLTTEDVTAFNGQVNKVDFTKYPVDIWIAKSGRRIDQIVIPWAQDTMSMSVRFTVDDYNQPVTVSAPSGAKSLLDVISGLITSGLLNDNTTSGGSTNPLGSLSL